MHDPTTTTGLEGLRIYKGDELVFDRLDRFRHPAVGVRRAPGPRRSLYARTLG